MTLEPEPNALLSLASAAPKARQQGAANVMKRARNEDLAALSSYERMTAVIADEWRRLTLPREPIVRALAIAMGDPETDLLVVNILAYALATAGEDGLTELIPLLSHDVFWIRAYAAEGLGSLNNTARWAVPSLARALEGFQSDWTAYTIIRALGNIGGPQATALLEQLAKTERARTTGDVPLLEALEEALASVRSQE